MRQRLDGRDDLIQIYIAVDRVDECACLVNDAALRKLVLRRTEAVEDRD